MRYYMWMKRFFSYRSNVLLYITLPTLVLLDWWWSGSITPLGGLWIGIVLAVGMICQTIEEATAKIIIVIVALIRRLDIRENTP